MNNIIDIKGINKNTKCEAELCIERLLEFAITDKPITQNERCDIIYISMILQTLLKEDFIKSQVKQSEIWGQKMALKHKTNFIKVLMESENEKE